MSDTLCTFTPNRSTEREACRRFPGPWVVVAGPQNQGRPGSFHIRPLWAGTSWQHDRWVEADRVTIITKA